MKRRLDHAAPFVAIFTLMTMQAWQASSQEKGARSGDAKPKTAGGPVSVNDPKALQGYTLIAPLNSTKTTLVDMQGRTVRRWPSDCQPGLHAYLLENGHLLRPGKVRSEELDFEGPPARAGAFKNSPGKAKWSGISNSTTRNNCRTMTYAKCPTAMC